MQALQRTFWSRWVKEYLPSLTKRSCWTEKTPNLEVGELVLVHEEDLKRRKWPLGRIVSVSPSEDGVVRVAKVKTKSGTYTRPATKLYKLEDNGNEPSN